jgi:hypothetical protein
MWTRVPLAVTIASAELDAATAQFLQGIAWETVQAYFRSGN